MSIAAEKANKPVLVFENLTTGYGTPSRHPVGQGLCATLPTASITAIVGRNGAGKSTLLRTLAGLQPALAGSIKWEGEELKAYSPNRLARTLSVVLTDKPDTGWLTAREVVAMGRQPYTGFSGRLTEDDKRICQQALCDAGAEALAARSLTSLSDGERQRVMVAKALAQQTPVILLDEPTAFLDFAGKIALLQLLQRLSEELGKTILLSTHDLELAFQLCHHLWLLSPDGIAAGSPRALADDGTLSAFFDTPDVQFDAKEMRFRYPLRNSASHCSLL